MNHGFLRHETLTFKCHGDQCKEGRTGLGPPDRQQMGATEAPVGDGNTCAHGRGVCRIPTSSISLIHRSMPSKDQRLVMSYTRRIPCKEKVGINRLRGQPDRSLLSQHRAPSGTHTLTPSTGRVRTVAQPDSFQEVMQVT